MKRPDPTRQTGRCSTAAHAMPARRNAWRGVITVTSVQVATANVRPSEVRARGENRAPARDSASLREQAL